MMATVLAVVVRYQTAFESAKTIQGLRAALRGRPSLAEDLDLLLWDNSPEVLSAGELPIAYTSHHSAENLGVSGAYNGALKFAVERGHTWMLLLDQDTDVTSDFLERMLHCAREQAANEEIAAILPRVLMRGTVISPLEQFAFNRHRPYSRNARGVARGEPSGINSGCMMRVTSLRDIDGFSLAFWLDHSDKYVFHQYFLRGLKIWLLPEASLEHELSMLDYDRLMSPWRYRNFSTAESAFSDLYEGRIASLLQSLRLLARAIKQRMKYENPEFSRIAWAQFWYRMRTRRNQRLAEWKEGAATRIRHARSAGHLNEEGQSSAI